MGQISYGTITITDTNDIEEIYMVYAGSNSDTVAPDSTNYSIWKTDISQVTGDYIWQRTVVKKSGIDITSLNFQDYYGDPVCITGPEGAQGAAARNITSITPYYYLSTSNTTQTGGSWSTTPATYPSTGTYYYWTKTITTYDSGSNSESTPVLDRALNTANENARSANNKATQAQSDASSAKSTAEQTQTNLNNYINLNDATVSALQTRTKYFWTNLVAKTNYPVGTYAASGIDGTTFNEEDASTYGYNTLYANGIKLRYNAINLGQLTGTALTFYRPSTSNQGNKAMELSASALQFFDSTGTVAQATFGGTQATISGTINVYDGKIGNGNGYWYIGNYTDYNQNDSAIIKSIGTASIQLNESNTWRISTNRIHTSWAPETGQDAFKLHFPVFNDKDNNSKYWDYGLHLPIGYNDKFLYIRNANSTESLDNLLNDLDDSGYGYWTYKFYVDGEGNLHAGDIYSHGTLISGTSAPYLLKSGGTMTGSITMSNGGKLIGDVTGNVSGSASKLANTSKIGDTNKPVYFTANGVPAAISYEINKTVPSDAIFTDKNVQTSQANTTKLYLVGTSITGTNTGTLNYDSGIYADTTAGALHATTFNGYTLAAASAKGVDTSITAASTSTNLPTSAAVATLVRNYLPLTGGSVTGAVTFGDSVSIDDLTVGDLIVNGSASFTNNLQVNTINGIAVGNNPKFTDTVTTATTSGSGNAVTSITASNGALTVKKDATFITSVTSSMVTTALGFTPYNATNPNGYTSNTGTVTSVQVQATAPLQSSTSTAQSTSLNTTISFKNQNANIVLAGPSSGDAAAPTFRALVAADIPNLAWSKITSGNDDLKAIEALTGTSGFLKKTAANTWTLDTNTYLTSYTETDPIFIASAAYNITSNDITNWNSKTSNTGTVTSVRVQATSPVTSSQNTAQTGTLNTTIALADAYGDTKNPYGSKTARYVLAAPANAAGAPSFRALTNADVGLSSVINELQVTGIGQGDDGKIRVYKGSNSYEDVAVEIVATESSTVASAQKLSSYGGSNKKPVYFPSTGTNAGKPVAIDYTIEKSVPSNAVFTDTTYTFANGTNGFTVTPLGGTAQTVTVTPSITNNVTGTGTSGSLAKWNGAHTLTDGPAIGTGTTKYLREDGTWQTPSGSVTGVKGNSESSYRTGQVNITKANIGLGNVDNTADANKNVLTATKFNSSRTVALTGDVTGSANGDGSSGWSIATTVGDDSHKHTMAYSHKPIQSKTYADTSYYATSSGSWEASSWYFMSVKPDAWYKPWKIRIRVHSFCPGYTNVESITDALITGRTDSIAYSNYTERCDTAHYYIPYYTLKKAGFDAGLGHAIGISILYGTGYTTSSYYRTFEVDFLEYENCTVTFFDTPVKWSGWTNGNTTNYNNLGSLDAVTRGYTESGDRNDANYQNRIYYTYKKPYTTLYRYQILLSRVDGTLLPVNSISNAPSNINKTLTTEEFDPFGEIYYYNTTTERSTSQNLDNAVLYRQVLADLRYSFNITNESGKCLTSSQPVYIVAVPQSNGMAKLASPALVQTLPSTEDGKIYIYIGQAYPDTYPYRCELPLYHPIYWYKNGAIRQYIGDAATVNNHTIASDVPSNAIFTDTWKALSTSQAGYVSQAPNDTGKFLRGDATWAAVTKANVGLGSVDNTADANKRVKGANITTTANAIAYYTDTAGTFGSKASANGVLYATATNGALNWGTLPVGQGGTGTTSFTANSVIMSGNTTTAALTTRSITNVTSGAVTASTNLVTANSLVSHVNNALGNYVTIAGDSETITGTKVFNNLLGTKYVATKGGSGCEITYNSTLDALVFSFA